MTRLRVREEAEAKGLNMSQLQIAAGVSMGLIRRYWYNQAKLVSLDALGHIAKALNVAAKDLITDEAEREGNKAK
jgi:transcriptional regulator with XRE-family HTH domain